MTNETKKIDGPSNLQATGGSGASSSSPFPRLRTGYMRAIAKAWRDPSFQKVLLNPPAPEDLDSKPPYDYGALSLLEELYGFSFPFNVKFVVSTQPVDADDPSSGQPQFRQYGVPGWFAHGDEIEIALPDRPVIPHPTLDTPKLFADALALYCEGFPSMLGIPRDGVSEPPDDFAEFGVVTARLLAMAWNDGAFKSKLVNAQDARGLVQASIGILVHWNFKITFKFYPWEDFWEGILDNTTEGLKQPQFLPPGMRPPRVKITVHLPLQPTDAAIWPVALAMYNDTGPQYPFTCA